MSASCEAQFHCDVDQLKAHTVLLINGEIPSCLGRVNTDLPWQVYEENGVLVVHVGKGIEVDKPLQLIFLCGTSKTIDMERSIRVQMEEKARLTLIHCTDSDPEIEARVCMNVELRLDKGAHLSWLSLQNINNRCVLHNRIHAYIKEKAILHTFFASLNGGVLKNEQTINLLGTEAEAHANGLYLVDGKQMVDNKVRVNHRFPSARSYQLFKGILDDSASGSFEGHVWVDAQAQKTEAYQTNRNMLLTPKAQFKTKPFLEIYADDVKCSHGATVGQLDENALFYMRCRGISASAAQRLLMQAFTEEVIQRIGVPVLETHLSTLVKQRLMGNLHQCDTCMLHCPEEQKGCNLPWA